MLPISLLSCLDLPFSLLATLSSHMHFYGIVQRRLRPNDSLHSGTRSGYAQRGARFRFIIRIFILLRSYPTFPNKQSLTCSATDSCRCRLLCRALMPICSPRSRRFAAVASASPWARQRAIAELLNSWASHRSRYIAVILHRRLSTLDAGNMQPVWR